MKKRFLLILTAVAAALCLLAPVTQAQVTPTYLTDGFTNGLTLGGTAYTNPANSAPISVPQGKGVALQLSYVGAAANSTGMVGCAFVPSIDGTNYVNDTNAYWWVLVRPRGVTTSYAFTNLPSALLDNAQWLKCIQVTNDNQATNMSATLKIYVGRR